MPSNNSKKLRKSTTKESINDLSGASSVQSQIVIKKDSTKRIKTKVASSNEQSSIPLGQQPSTSNSVHYREKLEQLLEDSKSKTFNKKEFKFGVKTKQYSAIYHFFDCKTEFDNKPNKDDKFNFKCIICKTVISSKLGKTSNLIKHLDDHDLFKQWKIQYDSNDVSEDDEIDENTYDIIKYFISSNSATKELKNKHLRSLLTRNKISLPTENSFVNILLPNFLAKVKSAIQFKLM